MDRSVSAEMWSPSTVTASVSGRSRAPLRPAGGFAHELFELLARGVRVGLLVSPFDVGEHALVARVVRALSPVAVLVADVDLLVGSEQHDVARPPGQLLPRCVEREAVGLADRLEDPVPVLERVARPRSQRPSLMDRVGSGTTRSASTSSRVPSPSQVGHAPYGELNEKFRGASSSNDSPQNVQASFCENVCSSSCPSWVVTAIDAIPPPARARSRCCPRHAAGCPAWRRDGRRRPRSCA